ncbi:MAG: hypothetical protein LBK71_00625 [Verrucomicrobiales bacterium]|nr:hypothetical protein [Verrucomicrobiales bacterium]
MKITSWSAGWVAGVLAASSLSAAEPSLTLYNQQFAVVREQVALSVAQGVSDVAFSQITAHVEPESVVLRDASGQAALTVLEQNYRNDPVSQDLLLQYFEGKTIDFEVADGDGKKRMVSGKIVRAPYVAHTQAMQRYNQQYRLSQMDRAYNYGGGSNTPIIEVDGKLRFSLPGLPLFPALSDDSILKPTLQWKLSSDREIKMPLELSYVSGGFNWSADYNLVLPEKGGTLTLTGWVTMDNQSGRSFKDASIKLMAGDVKKIQNDNSRYEGRPVAMPFGQAVGVDSNRVTEKSFDEYHLYTLPRKTDLLDRETKQVEFVNVSGVQSDLVYIYHGLKFDQDRYRGRDQESIRNDRAFGTQANKKVWVYREFENTEDNHLGIPLPKGRVRFYRQDSDGRLEFIGENEIDHSPAKEKVKIYTGDAFDLVGDRQRTDYKQKDDTLTESFKITVRNRKKETAQIRVVETLYRWPSWEMVESSDTYKKVDSNTVEYLTQLEPDAEKVITYTVKYSW